MCTTCLKLCVWRLIPFSYLLNFKQSTRKRINSKLFRGMSSVTHRAKVLAAYKELLSLIRRLPAERQTQALAEARQGMREHVHEDDLGRQSDLFKLLAARISFLRTITPKIPGDTSSIGAGHFVLRDGKLVEGVGTSAGMR